MAELVSVFSHGRKEPPCQRHRSGAALPREVRFSEFRGRSHQAACPPAYLRRESPLERNAPAGQKAAWKQAEWWSRPPASGGCGQSARTGRRYDSAQESALTYVSPPNKITGNTFCIKADKSCLFCLEPCEDCNKFVSNRHTKKPWEGWAKIRACSAMGILV